MLYILKADPIIKYNKLYNSRNKKKNTPLHFQKLSPLQQTNITNISANLNPHIMS